jgi:hypothetical protein
MERSHLHCYQFVTVSDSVCSVKANEIPQSKRVLLDTHKTWEIKRGESIGWRASQTGEQTIRLLFDEPKDLRRIWLRFSEPQVERTQQFTLRWADSQTGSSKEIVRQQWNFNPRSSTTEVEDHKVDLNHAVSLELIIDPDLGKNEAFAEWRVA